MPPKTYKPEQIKTLGADAEFNRRVSGDSELARLFDPSGDVLDVSEESARALGSGIVVCGVHIPPPSLGHLHTLASIESPFAKSVRTFDNVLHEVAEALFVLHYGARAVVPVCDVFRWRRRVAQLKREVLDSPAVAGALIDAEGKVEAQLKPWRRAVMIFAETHMRAAPGDGIMEAVNTLDAWIASAMTGLEMLPSAGAPVEDDPNAQKKTSLAQRLRQRLSAWRRGRVRG